MKCKKCGMSMFDKMLHRTNPTGQSDGGWMCIDCINKIEPELSENIKENKVIFDIEKIILNNPK